MAAVADVQTVTITLNSIELSVPKNELVVEAAKRVGAEIPIFCYHDRMKPVGMCRMCLVEVGTKAPDGSVRMMPKPQASCTLPCSEGLIINTDTEKIHTDRRSVLEMLLINHPLDCPICDRGGECPLQNNTLFYGPSTSRYIEVKRHAKKAFPLSKHVVLDLERCIQCGRCVRFTEEISGDSQLAFRFRGARMQPSTFELTAFESKFSGNVIEICPVGALTSADYRFRARPWDLETKEAICARCSNGCSIWLDHRLGKMVRVNARTNEAVNEEWTCDRGKFGHDFYNSDNRQTKVLLRKNGGMMEAEWPEAFAAISEAFVDKGNEVAVLAGPESSNEDLYALKELFIAGFGSANLDHRMTADLTPRPEQRCAVPIADLEQEPVILVFGTSLADELPIVFLRVRKAWFKHGAKVIVAATGDTDLDSFANAVLRFEPSQAADMLRALGGDAAAMAARGVSQEVVDLVRGATVLASEGIYDLPGGGDLVPLLQSLGRLSLFALGANDQGAHELGFVPQSGGSDTRAILEGCVKGSIKALWLAGVDPISALGGEQLARKALETVPFLVVQCHSKSEAALYASVILPQTAPAEMDGTWTNCEGRVQSMPAALLPKGAAKPGWKIATELSIRLSPSAPYFHAADVLREIARTVPAFAGASEDAISGEGLLLHLPATEPLGLEH